MTRNFYALVCSETTVEPEYVLGVNAYCENCGWTGSSLRAARAHAYQFRHDVAIETTKCKIVRSKKDKHPLDVPKCQR